MKTMARGLLVAFSLFAGGCAVQPGIGSRSADIADGYLGNWQGTVMQYGAPRAYPVEIDLHREPDGRLRAVSLYPEFGCVGRLTARKAEPQKITFDETLEPAQRCGPRREFALIWSIDGRVLYVAPKPPAQGTLLRASTSAGMSGVLVKYFGAEMRAVAPAGETPARPTIGELAQAVDSVFVRWSQVWRSERYILGSPRIGEVYWKTKAYVVNGRLEVQRSGQKLTLPFAAELQLQAGSLKLAGLCIDDAAYGQRCFDAESVAREMRQQDLKLVLTLGLVGAISSMARDLSPMDCRWEVSPAPAAYANATDGNGNPVNRTLHCNDPPK